jgi:hypothetical protein
MLSRRREQILLIPCPYHSFLSWLILSHVSTPASWQGFPPSLWDTILFVFINIDTFYLFNLFDTGIITTAFAPQIIIENSYLTIGEINADIAEASRKFRCTFLDHNPHSPAGKLLVIHPITDLQEKHLTPYHTLSL